MQNIYLSVGYFLDKVQDNTKVQIRNNSDTQIWTGKAKDFNYNETLSEKEVDSISVSMSNELVIVIKD